MYKKTGWFHPTAGKFIYISDEGWLSLDPSQLVEPPATRYWYKLIKQHGLQPGGRLTKFKSDNGFNVYFKPTGTATPSEFFIYNATGKKVTAFHGAVEVRKKFVAASNANRFVNIPGSPSPPKPTAKAPSPSNASNKTKTKFFTGTGDPIYIKNSQALYKSSGKGNWIILGPNAVKYTHTNTGKVKNGTVANLFKSAPVPPGTWKKTNFVAASDGTLQMSVKNSKIYYFGKQGWVNVPPTFKVHHKNNAKLKGLAKNILSFSKTGHHIAENSAPVYKFKNQYYVKKNGKFTAKFKGKALLPPLPKTAAVAKKPATPPASAPVVVPVPVQVPVVKPDPSHLVAPKNARIAKLGLLLKAIAARKKKLAKPQVNNHYANYCKNFNKGFGYVSRTNSVTFIYPELKGLSDGTPGWKDSLDRPKWQIGTKAFNISYNQFQFAEQMILKYHPPMKNFKNFDVGNMIDMTWFHKQNKWLKTLSPREIFLLYGFSHNGDVWAHSYLDGRFDWKLFNDGVMKLKPSQYLAFFFQAREFYKISTGDMKKDYDAVLYRVRSEKDVNAIKSIIQMFVDELNALCQKAPATTKPFVVWRGVKDDTYMTGIKDKQYVLNRFASTSIDGEVAFKFSKPTGSAQSHTVQRILVLPGSKCLCMFGMTKYSGEFEILLPRGSVYMIRKTDKDVKPLSLQTYICPGPSYPPQYNNTHKVKNFVDIILIGQSKKFKVATKTVTVPVVVPPAVSGNVKKMQNILNSINLKEITATNKIGKGGYGAVFKGYNSTLKTNVAVKLQKSSKNSNIELQALGNLYGTRVVPRLFNSSPAPWSQNAANLIPKGLASGNKAMVAVMSLAKGRPLKEILTGPPINKALKNKLTNAVGKVSARGWLHGNLHRNNIIVNNKGNPILIDFGKALKGPFTTTNAANKWLKGLAKGYVEKYGKKFYYSNNAKTRSHRSNKNFLNGLK